MCVLKRKCVKWGGFSIKMFSVNMKINILIHGCEPLLNLKCFSDVSHLLYIHTTNIVLSFRDIKEYKINTLKTLILTVEQAGVVVEYAEKGDWSSIHSVEIL